MSAVSRLDSRRRSKERKMKSRHYGGTRAETHSRLQQAQRVIGGHQARAALLEFMKGLLALLSIESFDGIGDQRDAAAAFEKALGRQANAKFRDHAKNDELAIRGKPVQNFIRRGIVEHVECLLFQIDLLKIKGVRWNRRVGRICDGEDLVALQLRNNLCAGRAAHTMRRKASEFGVIGRMLI